MAIWEAIILKLEPNTFQGRLQPWTSDGMMQTVEIEKLASNGLKSFWYLHVQPPMFDFIRYLLILPEIITDNKINLLSLDYRIYSFYIILFGILNIFVFKFGLLLGLKTKYAIFITMVWSLYPGNLLCATLLEGTYLSTCLLTISLYYLLKAIKNEKLATYCTFLIFTLLVSLTRTVFQIHILLPIIMFSYWFIFIKWSPIKKNVTIQLLASFFTLLLLALPVKQQLLFGTTSTTTFAGEHKIGILWVKYSEESLESIAVPSKIILNSEKFISKYNSPKNVIENYRLEQLFFENIKSKPFESLISLLKSLWLNLKNASHPTSNYTENLLVKYHPLLSLYNLIFSFPIYLIITFISMLSFWSRKKSLNISTFGLIQFTLFYSLLTLTILLANRYDWSESIRLKTLIEVPIFLIITKTLQDLLSTRVDKNRVKV